MRLHNFLILGGAILWSGAALASDVNKGPTWEVLALWAFGFITSGVGFYAKGLAGKVDSLNQRLGDLNTQMFREFLTKTELTSLKAEMKEDFKILNSKVDTLRSFHND